MVKKIGGLGKNVLAFRLIALCLFVLIVCPIVLAIPQAFSVNGRLTDETGTALSGTYWINFSIYTDASGGSSLWTSNQSVTTDSGGIYSARLTGIDLNFTGQYYLGVQIGADSEMTPRINLSSSGYAFRANTTTNLDGWATYSVGGLNASGKLCDSVGCIGDAIAGSGYWDKNGATMSPSTANDDINVTYAGYTRATLGGTSYGVYGYKDASGSAAGYFEDSNSYTSAQLADGSYGVTAYKASSGSAAGYFADNYGDYAYLADGMYGVSAYKAASGTAAGYFVDSNSYVPVTLADGSTGVTAYKGNSGSTAAGYFYDLYSNSVYLADGSYGISATRGSTGSAAGYFSDGTRSVEFADGIYAIDVGGGALTVDNGGNVTSAGIICDSVGCIGGAVAGVWNRSSATLSPATSNDDIYVDYSGYTQATLGGTSYGVSGYKDTSGSAAGYFSDTASNTAYLADGTSGVYGYKGSSGSYAGQFADSNGNYAYLADGTYAISVGSSALTVDNDGNVSTSGNVVASGTVCDSVGCIGGAGVWTKSSTTLSPSTSDDDVDVTTSGYTRATLGGQSYGVYGYKDASGSAAGYFADNYGDYAYLADGSYGVYAYKAASGSGAVYGYDSNSNVATLADGSYGVYGYKGSTGTAGGYFIDSNSYTSAQLADGSYGVYAYKAATGTGAVYGYDSNSNYATIADGSYGISATRGSTGSAAGYFSDGNSNYAYLADNTYGVYGVKGASGTSAGYFSDGTRSVEFADGIYAIDVGGGALTVDNGGNVTSAGIICDSVGCIGGAVAGVWNRTGTTLIPATLNDDINVTYSGYTQGKLGGTSYGVSGYKDSSGTAAGYFSDSNSNTVSLADGTYAYNDGSLTIGSGPTINSTGVTNVTITSAGGSVVIRLG